MLREGPGSKNSLALLGLTGPFLEKRTPKWVVGKFLREKDPEKVNREVFIEKRTLKEPKNTTVCQVRA